MKTGVIRDHCSNEYHIWVVGDHHWVFRDAGDRYRVYDHDSGRTVDYTFNLLREAREFARQRDEQWEAIAKRDKELREERWKREYEEDMKDRLLDNVVRLIEVDTSEIDLPLEAIIATVERKWHGYEFNRDRTRQGCAVAVFEWKGL